MSEFFRALERAERERTQQPRRMMEEAPSLERHLENESATAAATSTSSAPPDTSSARDTSPARLETFFKLVPAGPSVPIEAPRRTERRLRAFFRRVWPKGVQRPPRARLASVSSSRKLIACVDPKSVASEAFRALRATIEFLPTEKTCRNIVVTSPTVGEGKSTTVGNLAVVAAQSGWRVCLVDADFRRPVLHEIFGMPNRDGLTKALAEGLPLHAVAKPTHVSNLSLVVTGNQDGDNQSESLSVQRFGHLLQEVGDHYDLVLYDTPPVIQVADAISLAAQCDGVILVVRSGAIPTSVLRQAIRQITRVKGKVLGVVLNRVDLRRRDEEFYRYYRDYYGSKEDGHS